MSTPIEIGNENLLNTLKKNLNQDFTNRLHFDPELDFSYYPATDSYIFTCDKTDIATNSKIYFKFSLCFLEPLEYCSSDERNRLTIQELNALGAQRKDIVYAYIYNLDVTPRRQRIGTDLMNHFFNRISQTEKINRIYLNLGNDISYLFWSTLGFSHKTAAPSVGYHVIPSWVKLL